MSGVRWHCYGYGIQFMKSVSAGCSLSGNNSQQVVFTQVKIRQKLTAAYAGFMTK